MIAGIVSEYNPFHNGHLYHIAKTKEMGADYIVCVMSGNFVQRGECAFFDKWLRAKAAVMCGADIVIDLPTPWSCASAETFARGSIGLLYNFGIDALSFGCETDDAGLLRRCAKAKSDIKVSEKIKEKMSKGMTYPAAASEAVGEVYGKDTAEALISPNNTLAVEYIKQLMNYKKDITLIPVKREGADHDSDEVHGNISSASNIRSIGLDDGGLRFIPEKLYDLYREADICLPEYGERAVLSSLRQMKKEEYSLYVSDETGLASRIYEAVQSADSLSVLYDNSKAKNYTHSRVRREVISLFLKIKKEYSEGIPPYIKILAASEKGLSLLSGTKVNSSLPVITKHAEAKALDEKGREIYHRECVNTDLFALFSKKIRVCSLEQTHSLEIVR